MNFEYKKATESENKDIWEINIQNNIGDNRWMNWRDNCLKENANGQAATFVVKINNKPVGEGTLLFSPKCRAINGRKKLCDSSTTANVNALRIQKAYEGQGHISKLIKTMEAYAISEGYSHLTIGVEAKETRNLAIYLHLGFNEFVLSEVEDGELVLYYEKKLSE